MITLIGDCLIVLCAVLSTACVLAYQVTTGGAWWDTEHGRHLMAFMAAITGVLLLSTVRIFAVDVLGQSDPSWFQVLRLAAFASLPLVLSWRLWLILAADPKRGIPNIWRH